ncbi:MAG: hypothetical protein WCL29_05980 [Pseudomonadota bacterium]
MTEKNTTHNIQTVDFWLSVVFLNPGEFRDDFKFWLADNGHIYKEFESLSLQIASRRQHYSARTIVEKMRFDMAVRESGSSFKINGNFVPCLARLFALLHPIYASLFEFREHKAAA